MQAAIKTAYEEVLMFVIDETSMVDGFTLSVIDARLRQILPDRASLPFAGISMIFVGDFSQLPPINTSLVTPLGHPKLKGRVLDGVTTWNQVCDGAAVFILKETQRQRDPLFKETLSALRAGPPKLTREKLLELNQRHCITPETKLPENVQFLCPVNDLREEIIKERFKVFCAAAARDISPLDPPAWNKTMPLLIRASVWTRKPAGYKRLRPASNAVKHHVWNHCADKDLHDRCAGLGLLLGHLYRVTETEAIQCGLVKNMMIKVVDVVLNDPLAIVYDADAQVHTVDAQKVQLIVHLQSGSWGQHPACPHLPPGQVPMNPVWKSVSKVGTIKAPLSVCAFNLVSAACLSCHRFQGQTVPKLCLIGHKDAKWAELVVCAEYHYVAWTRVSIKHTHTHTHALACSRAACALFPTLIRAQAHVHTHPYSHAHTHTHLHAHSHRYANKMICSCVTRSLLTQLSSKKICRSCCMTLN